MQKQRNAVDSFAVGLAEIVLRMRWLVLLLAIAVCAAAASGGQYLEFSNNYRAFFSKENPELQAFEEFQKTYTKSDTMLFVIERDDGETVLSAETLAAVRELTEAAWKLPYVTRVDSITNFQYTYAEGDELIVEELVPDPSALDAAALDRLRSISLSEPLLKNQVIAESGLATAVLAVTTYPEKSLDEVPEAVAAGRALRQQISEAFPGHKISLTGSTMLNNAFGEAVRSDFALLIPAMFLIIAVTTAIALRSVSATLAVILLIALSMAAAMGLAGFAGIKLAGPSPSATIVILTLAIADSVHILITARGAMVRGMEKRAALVEAIRINFLPVLITSITTIVGFLALNFSDSPPFRDLGNISAVGIMIAWALSITLLPALLMISPFKPKAADPASGRRDGAQLLGSFGAFVVRFWAPLFVVSGVVGASLVYFIPTIELSDEFGKYFDHRIEFRRDTDAAGEHFGIYATEYSVKSGMPQGVTSPDYLKKVDAFADWLREQPNVMHVFSLTDILKRLNKNLNGDDPSFYVLPDDQELAAQYLLLYELSVPYGLDLNDRIDIDKSATRITVSLSRDTSTKAARQLYKDSAQWLEDNAPGLTSQPTGPQVMFTFIAQRNVESMVQGTTIAVVLIAIIMMIALRSIGLGLLSVVPNGLPILAAFGAWALMVGTVGFSVAAVASLSLGIVIDDTVHFLTKFNRARREYGLATRESIKYAFETVGFAILINTLVLGAGFAILMFSAFKINLELGLLTTTTIGLALLFDFLFLPGLLILTQRDRPKRSAA